MTRFVLKVGSQFVAAVYSSNEWMAFTKNPDDACSWVTYERAISAARIVCRRCNSEVFVHTVEEPAYPKSWSACRA